MADLDKVPDSQLDSQATYDPSADNATQPAESSAASESQDFRLIDCEESEKPTQEEVETIESKDEPLGAEKLAAIAEDQINAKLDTPLAPTLQKEQLTPVDKDETADAQTDAKAEEALLEEDDDEMDFIPSSQQETASPLKKQLSALVGGISQKRKAPLAEEPLAKFQRTCSREDALSSVRKKLEADNDVSISETVETSENDAPAVIINETPESCVDVLASESLQQVQEELGETLSQYVVAGDELNMTENSSPIKEKTSSGEPADERESRKRAGNERNNEDLKKTSDNTGPIEEKAVIPEVTEAKESPIKHRAAMDEAISSEASKEPEKIMSILVATVEEDAEQETHKESKIVETKDKQADDSALTSKARKSDDSGFGSMKIDVDPVTPALTQTSSNRSRMSIEVIYDKATAPPVKKRPRELVEIDEDGEKIVLDSSQEGCDKSMDKSTLDNNKTMDTSYKTCESKTSTDYKSVDGSKDSSNEFKSSYSLTNGSTDTKKTDSDNTVTVGSDLLDSTASNDKNSEAQSPIKKCRNILPTAKITEHPEVLSISDSEGDSFVEERSKNKLDLLSSTNHENSNVKILTIEKEISVLVKLKCLIHIDENTKEYVDKVLTSVHCEPTIPDLSSIRRRNSDTSACLADISGNDNKDTSPGSVTSNTQPYPLNPRLSLVSVVSSSSSSSAGSLNAALLAKTQFQLPRGPAKHAKKPTPEVATPERKQDHDESYEHIRKEWKNLNVLDVAVMNFANTELQGIDLHNGSTERPDNSLERIRSSTPELEEKNKTIVQAVTPKTTKRNRSTKRSRSKTAGSNGVAKASPSVFTDVEKMAITPSSSTKIKSSSETSTPSRQSSTVKEAASDGNDELIGKEVFAKWSDNKYYPGTVTSKTKTKYKVNFYDGQNKLIIEDFIVPMPATLDVGLSVYATSTEDDYGSCGIIVDVKKIKDKVTYVVETDEREKINVETKNLFLTNDQVQVLREEIKEDMKSPPSTPKHLGKVTLDNVVEGKRRSKRISTPVALTPKTKRARGSLADKSIDISKPSASGILAKTRSEVYYDTTSDSNCSVIEEPELLGIQPEVIGTMNEQETKGPSSRIKGKARNRKKSEDPEVVATLGPIPPANSNLFGGMSFLLTCASLDSLDRFQTDTKDSNSDPGTENEEEWCRKPFVRDRLTAQLTAGGGKLYDNFDDVPPEEYDNTKLIANVPNITKKSLLCLSVGIKAYNHQWIIRCCQENKIVNPSEEELPAGWSLMKQNYVEMYQRRNKKPFQTLPVIVVIPMTPSEKEFVSFWQQICENAGGGVLLPDNPEDGFLEGTVVLTNRRCPSWIIEKANSWSIPLISTTWVIQCLIEGEICTYDAHPSFAYNYVKRPSMSHISNLKRV